MKNLRNLHDPIPADWSYRRCHDWGVAVAERLGHVRGANVVPIFEKLGGIFDPVWETFGLYDDVYVYRPDKSWTATHSNRLSFEWYHGHRNEILVEGIAHLVLHFALVKERYGDTASMAISRYELNEAERKARQEATLVMIGFLIPDEAVKPMFIAGSDDATIAKAFGVSTKLVAARRRAVAKWSLEDAPAEMVEPA